MEMIRLNLTICSSVSLQWVKNVFQHHCPDVIRITLEDNLSESLPEIYLLDSWQIIAFASASRSKECHRWLGVDHPSSGTSISSRVLT